MYSLFRTILALTIVSVCITAAAQTTQPAKGAASIAGRVVVGGKGVAYATVILYRTGRSLEPSTTKVVTDREGRYTFNNLAAGQYNVIAAALAYVYVGDPDSRRMYKQVDVDEAEAVENVDFPLVRGSVITGRVTDPQGRPVIGEPVQVLNADGRRLNGHWSPDMLAIYGTDDRGVYRIFGLPAGRYVVSVGDDQNQGPLGVGMARASYRRTFHPDAGDLSQAKVVEIAEGGEAAGVDITIGRTIKKYTASGRIIDEVTGKPTPGVRISSLTLADGKQPTGRGPDANVDVKGNFRFEGLLPGRYVAVMGEVEGEGFTDPVHFEITDKDVTGLELRLKRGAMISGQAVISGSDSDQAAAQLSKLQVFALLNGDNQPMTRSFSIKINPDGSFRLGGLTPGKLQLSLAPGEVARSFSIIEIERSGGPQAASGLTITPDDQVINVKLVLGYGSGVVRGQYKLENGQLPPGAQVRATISAAGKSHPIRYSEVDERGRFAFEGLPTGAYEVIVHASVPGPGGNAQWSRTSREKVFVTSGLESRITVTLDGGQNKLQERRWGHARE